MAPQDISLTERQRSILQAIIEEYIATAEPVGSRTLTRRRSIELSPATVRNAMSDLEARGLLTAPHASAGRVPTPAAFRLYVEELAQRGRISARERELIQAITEAHTEHQDIAETLQEAGRVLSTISKHAALVLMPSLDEVIFAHIEFMPLREDAVLAVFVAKSGLIQHRVIDATFPVERDELIRMSNYLQGLLEGKTLREIRSEILQAMADERNAADKIMRNALLLGRQALSESRPREMLIQGERTFLDQPEFADIDKMRKLLRAFEEKTVLLRMLEAAALVPVGAEAQRSSDTQVVLGSDSSVRELQDVAAVTATYVSEAGPAGRVGVVGPTRMDYSRVIPLVELTADAVSQSLTSEVPSRAPPSGGKKPKS